MTRNEILVMVPLSDDQAAQLLKDAELSGPLPAVSVNRGLIETFEIDPKSTDGMAEAELAALQIAGVYGLRTHQRRLIVTAWVAAEQLRLDSQEANGMGEITAIAMRQLEAVFVESEPASAELLGNLQGQDIDAAWELATEFMAVSELLWHAPSELWRLLQPSSEQ